MHLARGLQRKADLQLLEHLSQSKQTYFVVHYTVTEYLGIYQEHERT